jgi:hypothetical protein
MKAAIVLLAATALGGAQQVGRELQVPRSPSEVTLEAVARDMRDHRQAMNDAFQQSRAELDKENAPLQRKIEAIQYQMRINQARVQERFNKISMEHQKGLMISSSQVQWLEKEVKKSAGLPEDAIFNTETGKWSAAK